MKNLAHLLFTGFLMITSSFRLFAITQEQWQEILNFGERDEGNSAEQALSSWLMTYAQSLNIDAMRYDLSHITGGMHSFGSNIGYYFTGLEDDELVFLIPQSHYDGSLIFALALAKHLSLQEILPFSVRIVFLSGEEAPHWLVASASMRNSIYPIGTQQLLRIGLINNDSYTFYYRIKDPTLSFDVGREQYLRSPYSLLQVMHGLAEFAGWQVVLPKTNVIPRKIHRKYSYPIDEYLSRELAAISVVGRNSEQAYSLDDTIRWAEEQAFYTWSYLSTSIEAVDREQEFNYFVLGNLIIKERAFISWLLFWILVILIFMTIKRHKLRSQWLQLRRKGKSIWLLLPLAFIALFLSTFITYTANMRRGEVGFWQYMPFAFASYKVIWTLFLFAMLGRLFEGLNLGGKERFYDISALVLASLSFLVFAIINVLYSMAWVWFLLVFILYDSIKQWHVRFILVLVAPVLVIFLASDFFFQSSPEVAQFLLFDSILGNLVLLLIFSPILMLIMSLFQQRKMIRMHQVPAYFSFLIYFILIITLHLFLRYHQPYDQKRQEPVWLLVKEEGMARRRVSVARIWSMQKLGSITLTNLKNGSVLSLVDLPSLVVDDIPIEPISNNFTLNVEFEDILNRTRTVITLDNLLEVEYLDLQVRSDRNFGVVDANVPIIVDDQQNLRILLGKNPPMRLVIHLISNDPIRVQVKATASYNIVKSMSLVRTNSYLDAAYAHIVRERMRSVLEI